MAYSSKDHNKIPSSSSNDITALFGRRKYYDMLGKKLDNKQSKSEFKPGNEEQQLQTVSSTSTANEDLLHSDENDKCSDRLNNKPNSLNNEDNVAVDDVNSEQDSVSSSFSSEQNLTLPFGRKKYYDLLGKKLDSANLKSFPNSVIEDDFGIEAVVKNRGLNITTSSDDEVAEASITSSDYFMKMECTVDTINNNTISANKVENQRLEETKSIDALSSYDGTTNDAAVTVIKPEDLEQDKTKLIDTSSSLDVSADDIIDAVIEMKESAQDETMLTGVMSPQHNIRADDGSVDVIVDGKKSGQLSVDVIENDNLDVIENDNLDVIENDNLDEATEIKTHACNDAAMKVDKSERLFASEIENERVEGLLSELPSRCNRRADNSDDSVLKLVKDLDREAAGFTEISPGRDGADTVVEMKELRQEEIKLSTAATSSLSYDIHSNNDSRDTVADVEISKQFSFNKIGIKNSRVTNVIEGNNDIGLNIDADGKAELFVTDSENEHVEELSKSPSSCHMDDGSNNSIVKIMKNFDQEATKLTDMPPSHHDDNFTDNGVDTIVKVKEVGQEEIKLSLAALSPSNDTFSNNDIDQVSEGNDAVADVKAAEGLEELLPNEIENQSLEVQRKSPSNQTATEFVSDVNSIEIMKKNSMENSSSKIGNEISSSQADSETSRLIIESDSQISNEKKSDQLRLDVEGSSNLTKVEFVSTSFNQGDLLHQQDFVEPCAIEASNNSERIIGDVDNEKILNNDNDDNFANNNNNNNNNNNSNSNSNSSDVDDGKFQTSNREHRDDNLPEADDQVQPLPSRLHHDTNADNLDDSSSGWRENSKNSFETQLSSSPKYHRSFGSADKNSDNIENNTNNAEWNEKRKLDDFSDISNTADREISLPVDSSAYRSDEDNGDSSGAVNRESYESDNVTKLLASSYVVAADEARNAELNDEILISGQKHYSCNVSNRFEEDNVKTEHNEDVHAGDEEIEYEGTAPNNETADEVESRISVVEEVSEAEDEEEQKELHILSNLVVPSEDGTFGESSLYSSYSYGHFNSSEDYHRASGNYSDGGTYACQRKHSDPELTEKDDEYGDSEKHTDEHLISVIYRNAENNHHRHSGNSDYDLYSSRNTVKQEQNSNTHHDSFIAESTRNLSSDDESACSEFHGWPRINVSSNAKYKIRKDIIDSMMALLGKKSTSLPYKGKKRGRKPKYIPLTREAAVNRTDNQLLLPFKKRYGLKSKYLFHRAGDLHSHPIQKMKKRGRPPKLSLMSNVANRYNNALANKFGMANQAVSATYFKPGASLQNRLSTNGNTDSILQPYKGKKRGRKPKFLSADATAAVTQSGVNIENIVTEDSEHSEMNNSISVIHSLPYKGKKRGRKPKSFTMQSIADSTTANNVINDEVNLAVTSPDTTEVNVTKMVEAPNISLLQKRKRGRPRRSPILSSAEVSYDNLSVNLSNEESASTLLTSLKPDDDLSESSRVDAANRLYKRKSLENYDNGDRIMTSEEMSKVSSVLKFCKDPASIDNGTEDFTSTRMVQCGLCNKEMMLGYYKQCHRVLHYYLCWLKDEEDPLNFEDIPNITRKLRHSIKPTAIKNKQIKLICPDCGKISRSEVGHIGHTSTCNRTITCTYCSKEIPAKTAKYHFNSHRKTMEHMSRLQGDEVPMTDTHNTSARKKLSINEDNILQRKRKRKKPVRLISQIDFKRLKHEAYGEEEILDTETFLNEHKNYWSILESQANLICVKKGCTFTCVKTETMINHFKNCRFKLYKYCCNFCTFSTNYWSIIGDHENVCDDLVDKDLKESVSGDDSEFNEQIGENDDSGSPSEIDDSINDDKMISSKIKAERKKATSIPCDMFWGVAFSPLQIAKWNANLQKAAFSDIPSEQLVPAKLNWRFISEAESVQYLPVTEKSAYISPGSNLPFKRLERFEGEIVDGIPVMYAGGPVYALSWLPKSDKSVEPSNDYLAVYCHPNMNHTFTSTKVYQFHSLIQIWEVPLSSIKDQNNTSLKPQFYLGLAHQFGVVWEIEWSPIGFHQHSLSNDVRLGILAAATSSGCIPVYSVPKYSSSTSNRFIKLEPELILKVMDEPLDQCTCITWEKTFPYSTIIGGFSNGVVAMWRIDLNSPLVKNGNILYPFRTFFAHSAEVTALSIHWLDGCRYLLTASVDRSLHCWDLEDNVLVPYASVEKSFVLDAAWLNCSLTAVAIYDITFMTFDQTCFLHHFRTDIEKPRSVFLHYHGLLRSVSISRWTNSMAAASNHGTVLCAAYDDVMTNRKCRPKNPKPYILSDCDVVTIESLKNKLATVEDVTHSEHEIFNLSDDDPTTYNNAVKKYAIQFSTEPVLKKSISAVEAISDYPLLSVNKVSWNPNISSFLHLAVGYQCGIVRIVHTNHIKNQDLNKVHKEIIVKPVL